MMLWVNGANDFAYPLPSWRKSYRLAKGRRASALRVRMPHRHPPGAKPEEISLFADSVLRKGPRPVRIRQQGFNTNSAWVRFEGTQPITKAELAFTLDTGKWRERKWEVIAAQVTGNKASAQLPPGTKAFYLNLLDAVGRVVSGEYQDR